MVLPLQTLLRNGAKTGIATVGDAPEAGATTRGPIGWGGRGNP